MTQNRHRVEYESLIAIESSALQVVDSNHQIITMAPLQGAIL